MLWRGSRLSLEAVLHAGHVLLRHRGHGRVDAVPEDDGVALALEQSIRLAAEIPRVGLRLLLVGQKDDVYRLRAVDGDPDRLRARAVAEGRRRADLPEAREALGRG